MRYLTHTGGWQQERDSHGDREHGSNVAANKIMDEGGDRQGQQEHRERSDNAKCRKDLQCQSRQAACGFSVRGPGNVHEATLIQ